MSLQDVVAQLKLLNEKQDTIANLFQKEFSTLHAKIDKQQLQLDALSKELHQAPQKMDNTTVDEQQQQADEIITLNVGGKIFTTTKETLCQRVGQTQSDEHYFAAMVKSCCTLTRDLQGHIVIDRDAKHFRYILNYLRCAGNLEECSLPWSSDIDMREIELEAKFYNFMELVDYISCKSLNKNKIFDSLHSTPNIELTNNNQTVRHLNTSWATIRCKNPLLLKVSNNTIATQTNYYEVRIDKTENQNIMVGLLNGHVDIKNSGNNWIGNFKDSYSFYCFDGRKYNCKLRVNGYGEECSTKDTIGLWVNVIDKKLYFYKNGKCMGAAVEQLPLENCAEWYFGVSLCDKDAQITLCPSEKPPSVPAP